MDAEQPWREARHRRTPVVVAATKPELVRAAIPLALLEAPALQGTPEDLEERVTELLALGEEGMRRRAAAVRARRRN